MLKTKAILFLLTLLLLSQPTSSQSTSTSTTATTNNTAASTTGVCSQCKCYKSRCSHIEDYTEDCENSFKNSCALATGIVEENECNLNCDCCLETKCYKWTSYFCFMYKTYDYFAVIYLMGISFNFFLLWSFYNKFFRIKKKYKRENYLEGTREDRNYFRYARSIYLKRYFDNKSHSTNDERIDDLFFKLEALRPIAFKSFFALMGISILFIILLIIDIFVIFYLDQKPFLYGSFCWVQHILHVIFYLLVNILPCVVKNYRLAVLEVFNDFETYHDCALRLIEAQHVVEINWSPIIRQYKKKKDKLAKKESGIGMKENTEKEKLRKYESGADNEDDGDEKANIKPL